MTDFETIRRDYPISHVAASLLGVVWDKAKSKPGDMYACCPIHSESDPSFHVEDSKGLWHCFSCGEGGDVIKLIELTHKVTAPEAARIITGEVKDAPAYQFDATPRADPYAGYKYLPAPADAPAITAGKRTPPLRNPKREDGKATTYTPEDVYPYYSADGALLGYVLRVVIGGKKLTPQIWWMESPDGWLGWSHGSLPGPRPLDGLLELIASPGKQILLVEGEKCRKAAAKALAGRVVVVSWMGGTQALGRTDFAPLNGRSVISWPDHDDPGSAAMESIRSRVSAQKWKSVTPYGDKGGDVADLIADGGDVAGYIKANIKEKSDDGLGVFRNCVSHGSVSDTDTDTDTNVSDSAPAASQPLQAIPARTVEKQDHDAPTVEPKHGRPGGIGTRNEPAVEPDPLAETWSERLEHTDKGGLIQASLHNAMMLTQYHPEFAGIYAYNGFAQEIALMRRPPWEPPNRKFKPRLLTEIDVIANTGYMETLGSAFKLRPKRSDMEASIKRVADFNRFNPVVETLEKLVWDGVPRIMGGTHGDRKFASAAVRYFGAENTNINAVFLMRTLVSGIARAMDPGCKVDTMLVLEGGQGSFKSTSLNVLADAIMPGLFTDEMSDPGSKDAGLQMQGKWIIEISELDAFRKSDVSTLKAWLARKVDRFRRPYGKNVEEFLRCSIMIGTVNPPESGYLRDPTGARRWWPIRCGEIDLALLKEDGPQLWAEARHLYLQGEQWHLTLGEERDAGIVQAARYEHDPWATMINDYLARIDGLKTTISVMELMGTGCINIHNERRTPTHSARIEAHLNMIGWRKVSQGIYKRPLDTHYS